MSYQETRKNRKLSDFCQSGTEKDPLNETQLLRVISEQDRQKYQYLKFEIDQVKADLEMIKPALGNARAGILRGLESMEIKKKDMERKYNPN